MNGARFNINESVSSLVASLSRRLTEITVGRRYMTATALNIIKSAESVAHFEQILTIGRLG